MPGLAPRSPSMNTMASRARHSRPTAPSRTSAASVSMTALRRSTFVATTGWSAKTPGSRPLCDPAARPLPIGVGDGPERPDFVCAQGDMNDRVSDDRNAPIRAYDYRRRWRADVRGQRHFGARRRRHTAAALLVEREQISPNNTSANIPAALAGAVIGGILGHQIGGGGGKDATTILGAMGGAAIGANVGRDSSGQQPYTQDVQRCDRPVGQVRPDYWDVTYVFRGREFHVQMVAPPGPTVTVNSEGEPRVIHQHPPSSSNRQRARNEPSLASDTELTISRFALTACLWVPCRNRTRAPPFRAGYLGRNAIRVFSLPTEHIPQAGRGRLLATPMRNAPCGGIRFRCGR